MTSDWIALALVVLTARWWWVLGAALLRDLEAASEPYGVLPAPSEDSPSGRPTLDADSRVPLNRVLAFRGVARRVSARRRWEGGFGRRGL